MVPAECTACCSYGDGPQDHPRLYAECLQFLEWTGQYDRIAQRVSVNQRWRYAC